MSESTADKLRRAANRLENPQIRVGCTVRYDSGDVCSNPTWRLRHGREFLVVDSGDEEDDRVTVWVPREHEGDTCRFDVIYPSRERLTVVVSEQDKATADWLRHTAVRVELSESASPGAVYREALAVARAILGEDST